MLFLAGKENLESKCRKHQKQEVSGSGRQNVVKGSRTPPSKTKFVETSGNIYKNAKVFLPRSENTGGRTSVPDLEVGAGVWVMGGDGGGCFCRAHLPEWESMVSPVLPGTVTQEGTMSEKQAQVSHLISTCRKVRIHASLVRSIKINLSLHLPKFKVTHGVFQFCGFVKRDPGLPAQRHVSIPPTLPTPTSLSFQPRAAGVPHEVTLALSHRDPLLLMTHSMPLVISDILGA